MKPLPIVCIVTLVARAVAWGGEPDPLTEPTGTLTLPQAVARALAASPDVRAAARGIRVQEGLVRQAGARPNPELQAEIENVGGSGGRQGFEETETTLRLAQRIELGGKRTARIRSAESERSLAGWEYEAARLAVVAATTKAFVTTLAAQERRALAVEMERLARETALAVDRSVAAGASAPADAARAHVAAARSDVEKAQAERALEGARNLLAGSWGADGARFLRVDGDLASLALVPPETGLRAALDRNPALARWASQRDARAAAMALERARRIPDLTIGAGGRHFSDNGDNALVFEVSMPLPLFDRNHGGIAAARERLAQAKDEAVAARASARMALMEAQGRLAEAHALAVGLGATVVPDARRAVDDTLDAFRKGALRAVDVLEARRALVEVERERLDALERYHLAAADVERLTATPLEFPTRGEEP